MLFFEQLPADRAIITKNNNPLFIIMRKELSRMNVVCLVFIVMVFNLRQDNEKNGNRQNNSLV